MESVAEKRKGVRRAVTYPAFLELGDGSPPLACTLCDVSQDGAQIFVANAEKLPKEFILALSADGAARRRCRVVWQNEADLGVRFLKDIRKPAQPRRAWMHPMMSNPAAEGQADAPAEAIAEANEPPARS